MAQVQVEYIDSLFGLAHEVRQTGNDFESCASRIAAETHTMSSLALNLVERVRAGVELAERALYEAERDYDEYRSRPEEERSSSVEAELREAVRNAATNLRAAEADLRAIESLKASMEGYCSSLYSTVGGASSVRSTLESMAYKIDQEASVLQEYAG